MPQPTEWQGIGNQIDAVTVFAGTHFVNVLLASHATIHITLSLLYGEQKRQESSASEVTGKLSLTISAKPVGVGALSQRLIPTGERSGLQTQIARRKAFRCARG